MLYGFSFTKKQQQRSSLSRFLRESAKQTSKHEMSRKMRKQTRGLSFFSVSQNRCEYGEGLQICQSKINKLGLRCVLSCCFFSMFEAILHASTHAHKSSYLLKTISIKHAGIAPIPLVCTTNQKAASLDQVVYYLAFFSPCSKQFYTHPPTHKNGAHARKNNNYACEGIFPLPSCAWPFNNFEAFKQDIMWERQQWLQISAFWPIFSYIASHSTTTQAPDANKTSPRRSPNMCLRWTSLTIQSLEYFKMSNSLWTRVCATTYLRSPIRTKIWAYKVAAMSWLCLTDTETTNALISIEICQKLSKKLPFSPHKTNDNFCRFLSKKTGTISFFLSLAKSRQSVKNQFVAQDNNKHTC